MIFHSVEEKNCISFFFIFFETKKSSTIDNLSRLKSDNFKTIITLFSCLLSEFIAHFLRIFNKLSILLFEIFSTEITSWSFIESITSEVFKLR